MEVQHGPQCWRPPFILPPRNDALPISRQLPLLILLDQAISVVRGAACAMTLLAQSDCDAQGDGIAALRSTSADALRGLCQAALALLADRISEVGEGSRPQRQRRPSDIKCGAH